MVNATEPDKKQQVIPVVISGAIQRTIAELMANRREFNRSKLMRDAVIEMADRDLPKNWRETVGYETEESAA